jgi:hypothetical protein
VSIVNVANGLAKLELERETGEEADTAVMELHRRDVSDE